MTDIFSNIFEGATIGGLLGAAAEAIIVAGATMVAGPVGAAFALAAAPEVMGTGAAIGTTVGAGAGVVKTVVEEKIGDNSGGEE